MNDINGRDIRPIIRGYYDLQKERIAMGLKVVADFKARLGQDPGEKEEGLDPQAKKILEDLRAEYSRLSDGVNKIPTVKAFEKSKRNLIDNYPQLLLIGTYNMLLENENQIKARLGPFIKRHPLWDAFFEGVKGCGEMMAAVIVSEIDISKARYISSLWRYCGLDVHRYENEEGEMVGEARRIKKSQMRETTYIDKDGKEQTKKTIGFNPFLQSKLIAVLGDCLIKASDPKYSDLYRNYKTRYENHVRYKDSSKMHRHKMARRAMVKIFVADLYKAWRKIEGLPVHEYYCVDKLGHRIHGATPESMLASLPDDMRALVLKLAKMVSGDQPGEGSEAA